MQRTFYDLLIAIADSIITKRKIRFLKNASDGSDTPATPTTTTTANKQTGELLQRITTYYVHTA